MDRSAAAVREAEREREAAKVASRAAHRLDARWTVEAVFGLTMDGSVDNGSVLGVGGSLVVGRAQNLASWFGLWPRVRLSIGSPHYSFVPKDAPDGESDRGPSDGALMYGASAELVPYFGPFGRFYVGPLLWLGYVGYEKGELVSADPATGLPVGVQLESGVRAGWGSVFGLLLGAHEEGSIFLDVRAGLVGPASHRFSMGIGGGLRF